ncbi:MAG: Ribosomal RNA small subunit methyltransferase I [bacterium ADurb.BinA186]|nr:MAG: Ribosomal RNA small subunit methyltransferase I [bacterium ADurb.BinA186]
MKVESAKIVPVPGASAVAAAISVSGMVEKEFYFAGFLPKKKGRQTTFKLLTSLDCPIVIYESAIRLPKTLGDIKEYFGDDSEVFIAREMTKMFEEYWGGNVLEVISGLKEHKMKGELVLIVKSVKLKV